MADSPTAEDLMTQFESGKTAQASTEQQEATASTAETTSTEETSTAEETATETTESTETTATETETTEQTEQTTTEEKKDEPPNPEDAEGRFRLRGKLAAVAQLVKEGISEPEAIQRVYGEFTNEPEPKTEPEPPKPDPIEALQKEQAEITAKLDEAAKDGAVLDSDLLKLMDRKAEIRLEIRDAKAAKAQAEAEQAQAAEAEADKQWNEDLTTVHGMYGDTSKDDGELGKAMIDEFDKAAKDKKHPFHALWNEGTLTPLVMAPYVAAKKGIQPVAAKSAAPPAKPAAPVQEPRRAPVSAAQRSTPPPASNAAAVRQAQKEAIAKATSADEIADIFAKANNPNGSAVSSFRLA